MSIFKENYQAVVNRGLITPKTKDSEFINKMIEELREIIEETDEQKKMIEIGDLMTVCSCYLIHKKYDPDIILKEVLIKNKNRTNRIIETEID